MATSYSEVFSLFLGAIQDYNIDALYSSSSPENADIYMTDFLVRCIPNFYNCNQNLESRNDITRTFSITLTTSEKVILSNLMVVEWLRREVNNINQINLHLSDANFKHYAEANNLKEKKDLLSTFEERAEKQMSKYKYSNFDWNDLG